MSEIIARGAEGAMGINNWLVVNESKFVATLNNIYNLIIYNNNNNINIYINILKNINIYI